MTAAELVARVRAAGFAAELRGGAPQLVRVVAGSELPAGLLDDLRAHRDAVLAHLREFACGGCGRQRDGRKRCYHCDTMPCVRCGRGTGSSLYSTCDICAVAEATR